MSEPSLDQVLAYMGQIAGRLAACRWWECRKRRQLADALVWQVPVAAAAREREQ